MTLEELQAIADAVGERRGWDFARVRDEREPVPWDYAEVVHRYLQPASRVLDVGTGGGERFLRLAPYLGTGIGIDLNSDMIQAARENTPVHLASKVSFEVMDGRTIRFPNETFDLALNRHSTIFPTEIARVLRPEGLFITQQVGARNTSNICAVFGCGAGGEYQTEPGQDLDTLGQHFRQQGCTVIARAEYDVRYWFKDVESFVFWLKAIPMPEDFRPEKHWQQVAGILADFRRPRGIETNEHRELLIVHKR